MREIDPNKRDHWPRSLRKGKGVSIDAQLAAARALVDTLERSGAELPGGGIYARRRLERARALIVELSGTELPSTTEVLSEVGVTLFTRSAK
jgi:hypothetical protein